MTKRLLSTIAILFFASSVFAQTDHRMSDAEKKDLPYYNSLRNNPPANASVTPPSSPVRTIAEWEELQALVVGWKSYPSILREIVRAAKLQCKVMLLYDTPDNVAGITAYLNAGGVDTANVMIVNTPINSVWCRDYGHWNAYTNDVDTLITIDWIYNRPRPKDDSVPTSIANLTGTPLYQTTTAPYDLVHTGGNFMCDGFGTGFSSKLILTDNTLAAGFNVSHTAAEIDTIMSKFMGISRYIKMNTLPYDQIHHIDMHMKLLDEETILMGQYPNGIADGPQIEANLQFVLANYMSYYGTPYKVIRIPMPPDNGQYPPTNGADYFTYTNSSFINNTIIVPTYNIPQDSTALRIYREALPGYNVVGINSTGSIGALGALHCITKEVATGDPLLIAHQSLNNTTDTMNGYDVTARIQHRSGIAAAYIYYRTDTSQPYVAVPMISLSSNINHWGGLITAQIPGTRVYYYVAADAVSGKHQVRPMPAPAGYWKFDVLAPTAIGEEGPAEQMLNAFPNPSKGITCIPLNLSASEKITASLTDVNGRTVAIIYDGFLNKGEQKLFVNTENVAAGVYLISVNGSQSNHHQKLIVK